MRNPRAFARAALAAAAALLAALLVGPALAQSGDVFDFIPQGGRTLLAKSLAGRPPADAVRALLSGRHTRDAWLVELRSRARTIAGLQRLNEKELLTLADYMSFNMPLPAGRIPANPAQANWEKILPLDGRDLVLDYCQGCHIITVVVTQDRPREHWLGSLNKPSHIQIKLSREQREALVGYLVLNAAIPIDLVPEDLRAGGATY